MCAVQPGSSADRSARRRRRRRLLALVLGTVVALGSAEIGTRVFLAWRTGRIGMQWEAWARRPAVPPEGTSRSGHLLRPHPDSRIIFELVPDMDVVFCGARVTTNSRGFRGPERSPEPDPGVVRIVAIGDSVLFGWGVGDDETWLAVLERRLSERPGGCRYETINTGVPGYNTVMEVSVLETKGLAFRPDIVLIDYVGNDLDLPNFLPREEDFTDLSRSYLWEACKAVIKGRAGHMARPFEPAPMADGHFERDPERVPEPYRGLVGLEAYRRAMARLAELGREHGFEVLVTSHLGVPAFVKDTCDEVGFPIADAGARVKAWLAENGNPRYLSSPLTLSEDDPHPTPVLHAMQAEAVHEGLVESGILDRAERRRCR